MSYKDALQEILTVANDDDALHGGHDIFKCTNEAHWFYPEQDDWRCRHCGSRWWDIIDGPASTPIEYIFEAIAAKGLKS
jgi:hypothetical protein